MNHNNPSSNQLSKIVIFIPCLSYEGGAERVAVSQGEMFKQMGHEVEYITMYEGDYTLPGHHNFNYSRSLYTQTLGVFTSAYRLYRQVRDVQAGVVISHLPRMNHAAALARLFDKSKERSYIGVVHNSDHNGRLNTYAMRLLWKYLDQVVCVSRGVEEAVKALDLNRAITIYNPFDFEQLKKRSEEQMSEEEKAYFRDPSVYTVLQVARFVDQKNHLLALDALEKALEENSRLQLLFLGDGPNKADITQEITRRKLDSRVHILEVRDNPFPLMRGADCVWLTSLHEGLPTVLIESLAVETPVISTDCLSGPREIAGDSTPYGQPLLYPYVTPWSTLVSDPSVVSHEEVVRDLARALLDRASQAREFNGPKATHAHLAIFDRDEVAHKWQSVL